MDSDTNATQTIAAADAGPATRYADWTGYNDPSTAIAELVAEATGRAQTDLEPLQHTIDADALDTLYDTTQTDYLEVTFRYEGVDVRVTSRGVVEVVT